MKLKKLVSLGLATLMAAGILAGCSGSTTSESAAGDSSASESTAPSRLFIVERRCPGRPVITGLPSGR